MLALQEILLSGIECRWHVQCCGVGTSSDTFESDYFQSHEPFMSRAEVTLRICSRQLLYHQMSKLHSVNPRISSHGTLVRQRNMTSQAHALSGDTKQDAHDADYAVASYELFIRPLQLISERHFAPHRRVLISPTSLAQPKTDSKHAH